jgi:hypothetical protein
VPAQHIHQAWRKPLTYFRIYLSIIPCCHSTPLLTFPPMSVCHACHASTSPVLQETRMNMLTSTNRPHSRVVRSVFVLFDPKNARSALLSRQFCLYLKPTRGSATVVLSRVVVLVIALAVELYVLLQIKGLHDHRGLIPWFMMRCMLAGDGDSTCCPSMIGTALSILYSSNLLYQTFVQVHSAIIETLQYRHRSLVAKCRIGGCRRYDG